MMCRALYLAAACLLAATASAQDERVSNQPPLQTQLLNALDAGHLKPGSPVMAKVLYNWSAPGCTLASGSTATGKIVEAHTDKAAHQSTITVRMDAADCNGRLGAPLLMRIFAVILAPPPTYERAFTDGGGLFGSYSPTPAKTPQGTAAPVGVDNSVHRADLLNDMTVAHDQVSLKLSRVIQASDVFGDKTLKLDPNGPDGASILRKSDKTFRLEAGTKLVLMPVRTPPPTAMAKTKQEPPPSTPAPAAVRTSTLAIAPLPARPKDEIEVCASACSTVPALSSAALAKTAGDTIALTGLGYGRPDHRELFTFHHAYTLTYLDPQHLLFTFDLHKIRIRQTGGLRPDYVHTVRAVLLDPSIRAVQRVVDWQVIGEEQYLWRASNGHVLVHLGHQLLLLDANLNTTAHFDLPDDPLAWVAVSPDARTFAAGVVHERHTPQVHRDLAEATNVEPEESIAVTVLDASLQPLGTSTQPSTVAPPVLSSGGELRVLPMDRHQWELEEFGWDGKPHRIAVTVSDCQPRVSLPTAQTLFLAGCTGGQSWYRALRTDGHTIVRGTPSSQQFEQAAEGDAANNAFAVRVVWSSVSLDTRARFKPADLRGEQVVVYRNTGERLLLSEVPDVPLAEQSFALAPNAGQLAVLGTHGIYLYPIGHPHDTKAAVSPAPTPHETGN